jgi:hypothetical protein
VVEVAKNRLVKQYELLLIGHFGSDDEAMLQCIAAQCCSRHCHIDIGVGIGTGPRKFRINRRSTGVPGNSREYQDIS